MSSPRVPRSASVGTLPREKKHYTSRAESAAAASLDVRCACQYFQCDSLLPERVNPVGSRPESSMGFTAEVSEPTFGQLSGHQFLQPGKSRMHPDQISTKSFPVGHYHTDPMSITNRGLGIERQPAFDELSTHKDLVIMPITPEPHPVMKRGFSTDRLSNRSFGGHGRDFDTISNRSGLRRLSRTPSKTDLFVADINIPTVSSRRGSKADIPQLNFEPPTPLPKGPTPFSILDYKPSNYYDDDKRGGSGAASPSQFADNKENLPNQQQLTDGKQQQTYPRDSYGRGGSQYQEYPRAPTPDPLEEGTKQKSRAPRPPLEMTRERARSKRSFQKKDKKRSPPPPQSFSTDQSMEASKKRVQTPEPPLPSPSKMLFNTSLSKARSPTRNHSPHNFQGRTQSPNSFPSPMKLLFDTSKPQTLSPMTTTTTNRNQQDSAAKKSRSPDLRKSGLKQFFTPKKGRTQSPSHFQPIDDFTVGLQLHEPETTAMTPDFSIWTEEKQSLKGRKSRSRTRRREPDKIQQHIPATQLTQEKRTPYPSMNQNTGKLPTFEPYSSPYALSSDRVLAPASEQQLISRLSPTLDLGMPLEPKNRFFGGQKRKSKSSTAIPPFSCEIPQPSRNAVKPQSPHRRPSPLSKFFKPKIQSPESYQTASESQIFPVSPYQDHTLHLELHNQIPGTQSLGRSPNRLKKFFAPKDSQKMHASSYQTPAIADSLNTILGTQSLERSPNRLKKLFGQKESQIFPASQHQGPMSPFINAEFLSPVPGTQSLERSPNRLKKFFTPKGKLVSDIDLQLSREVRERAPTPDPYSRSTQSWFGPKKQLVRSPSLPPSMNKRLRTPVIRKNPFKQLFETNKDKSYYMNPPSFEIGQQENIGKSNFSFLSKKRVVRSPSLPPSTRKERQRSPIPRKNLFKNCFEKKKDTKHYMHAPPPQTTIQNDAEISFLLSGAEEKKMRSPSLSPSNLKTKKARSSSFLTITDLGKQRSPGLSPTRNDLDRPRSSISLSTEKNLEKPCGTQCVSPTSKNLDRPRSSIFFSTGKTKIQRSPSFSLTRSDLNRPRASIFLSTDKNLEKPRSPSVSLLSQTQRSPSFSPTRNDVDRPRSSIFFSKGKTKIIRSPSFSPTSSDLEKPRTSSFFSTGKTKIHRSPSFSPTSSDLEKPRTSIFFSTGKTKIHRSPSFSPTSSDLEKPRTSIFFSTDKKIRSPSLSPTAIRRKPQSSHFKLPFFRERKSLAHPACDPSEQIHAIEPLVSAFKKQNTNNTFPRINKKATFAEITPLQPPADTKKKRTSILGIQKTIQKKSPSPKHKRRHDSIPTIDSHDPSKHKTLATTFKHIFSSGSDKSVEPQTVQLLDGAPSALGVVRRKSGYEVHIKKVFDGDILPFKTDELSQYSATEKYAPSPPPDLESMRQASIQPEEIEVQSNLQRERSPSFITAPIPIISRQGTPVPPDSQQNLDQTQRIYRSNLLRRKQYLSRTRSQDRQDTTRSFGGASCELPPPAGPMVKTVSFDFGAHRSKLASSRDQTPSKYGSNLRDKRDWIERTYFMRDHEYEPIGEPQGEQQVLPKEPTPSPQLQEFGSLSEGGLAIIPFGEQKRKAEVEEDQEIKQIRLSEYDEGLTGEEAAHSLQQDIEERYFSSIPTTPRTDSRTDNEIHTSQVDSSAIEELPLKSEARRKGFMASAQDRGKKMQQNIRSHAGKIKSKISGMKKPSGSPKSKEKKRFKAPEFSKMKMPDIKRPEFSKFKAPDMSKLKKMEFKRPDMSKFRNIPERFSSMKKKKEKPSNEEEEESELPADFESGTTPESAPSTKKRFEFNFATYPRMLRKKKQKHSTIVIARADDVQSSETPPSLESSTVPRFPRSTKGPVGSKWTDKFSDVSYGGDSESGKYQRYGSEVESIERESSMERRMKEDLERSSREEEELGQIRTEEQRQFADYDEENRAIHEISKTREGEFKKRRPMVHQDSGVSEESKELGWSEKDILRNKVLNQNESDQDNGLYPSEEALGDSVTNTNQETQSTGSSNALRQKGVIEEIDDDEFFLRKRGISQDNIEIREYISSAIREGLTTPVNALAKLGTSEEYYPNELDMSNEQMNYGYDVPPPKPRRVKDYNTSDLNVESGDLSQSYDGEEAKDSYEDNFSLPQEDVDFFKGLPPNRPLRKTRHQYSRESQEDHEVPPGDVEYFEDDEKPFYRAELPGVGGFHEVVSTEPPKAPKRRRRQQMRRSVEKEHPYLNGFSGRSVSNSFIPEGQMEPEMIVYRTQHEYIIPLPQVDHFTPPTAPRRSRSRSQVTEDDRTSHGADSLQLDEMQPVEHVEEKFHIEIKENDGYATVRKEPPPRPPAPVRRKRSTNSPRRDFSTLPTQKTTEPEKSTRSYRTIGPSKPPRRKSDLELKEQQKRASSPDVTEYEELDVDYIDDQTESPEAQRDLQSGEVINKMKYRPLPPPPRPPREGRKHKDAGDNKFDKDGGGEKIENNLEHGENENYDIQKTTEKFIEIDVAVQTDPLPEDFVFEEFEITDDMKIIEPRRISKTLEDILKEEQQAEIERAKQLADAEALNRGIQRFRESNQRSFSEKSKTSTDRPRSQSRPTTPSAIVIEKRVPTPIPNTSPRETMLEASLTVQPIDDDYDIEKEIEEELRRDREREIDEQLRRERERVEQERKKREVEEEIERQLQQQYEIENPFERELAEDTEEHVQAHITPYQEEEQRLIATSHPEENDSEIPIEESDMELPPLPPPRKRSGGHGAEETSADKPKEKSPLSTTTTTTTTTTVQQETSLIPIHEAIAQEQGIVQSTPPTRLAVADLEVERLSVNALQASRIMVSQLQGASVSADELNCKSGNLVVKNIEFPPGFIEEIVERVRSTDREHSQTQARTVNAPPTIPPSPPLSSPPSEEPPARPPPPQPPLFPSEYMQFSQPPAAFFQLRSPVEDDYQQLPPTHRRRRHHRRRDSSSSEEDAHREHRRSRHSTQSPEPTIGQLSGQLLSACGSSVLRTMNQIVNMLRSSEKTGNERHISTAIVIIILTTLAFLLLGMTGDKNIHHHHWDYFNPPGNGGRG